jgi:leucyl/phenylalanyl-tRNA---protein transferase
VRHILERLEVAKKVRNFDVLARRRLAPPAAFALGVAGQLIEPAIGRVGVYTKTPPASEIVANYARGWLLFGSSFPNVRGLKWHRFPQRAVVTRETVRIPKRLKELQHRLDMEIRFDEDFETIVAQCREGRSGWLTAELVSAYRGVHELGFISTVGTYRDGRLIGGMWGMTVGRTFGIQSMFHVENDAGSLALVAVLDKVMAGDQWSVVDFVLLSDHFERFGAQEIPTEKFCELVWRSMLPSGGP